MVLHGVICALQQGRHFTESDDLMPESHAICALSCGNTTEFDR
jgi:hypothetical protein